MIPDSDGRQLLIALKSCAGKPGPQPLLHVGKGNAFLRVVATRQEIQDPGDVRRLTEWRNLFVGAFLNEFVATEARTADWLSSVVGPDDSRILFMVEDSGRNTVGYMGVGFIDWAAGYGEADSIVRGLPATKGLMRLAMGTMVSWAQGQLGLGKIGVRVRSDNPALQFYRDFGFEEIRRVPLKRIDRGDVVEWREDPVAGDEDVSLVHMMLARTHDAS